MSEHTWYYHPIDTNVHVVSARLLLLWARFRMTQLPLFNAIRTGDLPGAAEAFKPLTELARDIIETANSAPNTEAVGRLWMKFHLLPERLNAVRMRLPELVDRRRLPALEWRL
jgi:hypothetical protein